MRQPKYSLFLLAAVLVANAIGRARADEPASPRVEWQSDVYASYKRAAQENKPLVVLFWSSRCSECRGPCLNCAKLVAGVLNSDDFHAQANRAVFAEVDFTLIEKTAPAKEAENARQMADNLQIKSFPILVVCRPGFDAIYEEGRVEGYQESDAFLRRFLPLLDEAVTHMTKIPTPQ